MDWRSNSILQLDHRLTCQWFVHFGIGGEYPDLRLRQSAMMFLGDLTLGQLGLLKLQRAEFFSASINA